LSWNLIKRNALIRTMVLLDKIGLSHRLRLIGTSYKGSDFPIHPISYSIGLKLPLLDWGALQAVRPMIRSICALKRIVSPAFDLGGSTESSPVSPSTVTFMKQLNATGISSAEIS